MELLCQAKGNFSFEEPQTYHRQKGQPKRLNAHVTAMEIDWHPAEIYNELPHGLHMTNRKGYCAMRALLTVIKELNDNGHDDEGDLDDVLRLLVQHVRDDVSPSR